MAATIPSTPAPSPAAGTGGGPRLGLALGSGAAGNGLASFGWRRSAFPNAKNSVLIDGYYFPFHTFKQ